MRATVRGTDRGWLPLASALFQHHRSTATGGWCLLDAAVVARTLYASAGQTAGSCREDWLPALLRHEDGDADNSTDGDDAGKSPNHQIE